MVGRVRRSALIDIDPGLLQFWLSHNQLRLASHDKYFTTGEHIGSQRVPHCGYPWIRIPPVVDTRSWTFDGPPTNDAFTTVTHWFGEWLTHGTGWLIDNSKRIEFLRIVDLPSRTHQPLELAVCLGENDEDVADRELLVRNGWRVRHSFQVSRNPQVYREDIRTSRGEFSCVKPSCLFFQNAWISDRTLCYLASGRRAVVQHTGPSSYSPNGDGLFRFTTVDEAVAAFELINSDYDYQCDAARQLAEKVLRRGSSRSNCAGSGAGMTRSRTAVVFGLMFDLPYAGNAHQFLHYLYGLRSLGWDVWYVEDSRLWPYDPITRSDVSDPLVNVERISPILAQHGFGERWIFRTGTSPRRCYGAGEEALRRLLRGADLALNVTGCQEIRQEHTHLPLLVTAVGPLRLSGSRRAR